MVLMNPFPLSNCRMHSPKSETPIKIRVNSLRYIIFPNDKTGKALWENPEGYGWLLYSKQSNWSFATEARITLDEGHKVSFISSR